MIELRLQSIIIFLAKVTLKIGQAKWLLSILLWKLIPGDIKLKIWTEKKIGSFLFKKIAVK